MALSAQPAGYAGARRSILDLAPLELDCMNALWSLGEGTVRQIQQWLAASRPRAYTTIMTIMDRLARKGVVTREKAGRAYVYRPNLTAEEARTHALDQIVAGFFKGSTDALVAHLAGGSDALPLARAQRARRHLVGTGAQRQAGALDEMRRQSAEPQADSIWSSPPPRLDESLL